MDEKHKDKLSELKKTTPCQKGFCCLENDLKALCRARDIGVNSYVDCLEVNAENCKFALAFGSIFMCSCPIRVYIAKNSLKNKI